MFDNQSNAQNVLLGSSLQSFTGAVSSYDGADFYKLQVNNRSNLSLSLYGLSSDANAYLFNSTSQLLASSTNSGSSSEAINTTLDAGTYYVKVDRSALNKDPLFTGSPYQIAFSNDPLFRNIDDKNPNGQMFAVGDFNGDGVRDVFRQERGNWVDGVKDAEVMLGKANGGYNAPIQISNSGLFEGNHNRLTFGDFNGDGKTDIIRQEYNGWIDGVNDTQFASFQNGNFQVVGNVADMGMMRGDLTNLIAGDFNGDGKTDIIRQEKGTWVNGNRDVELYISNGTFGWASQTVLANTNAINGNDCLLVAGDFIAGGGKDLMRIETNNSWINGVNDIQYLTYQNGNMTVVSNTPTNIAPQTVTINGLKSGYDANSTLTIDPSSVSDHNGWQDVNLVDFWLTNDRGQRVELADVNSFTANGTNLAKFNYSTSLAGIAVGNYQLNAIAYDKAGTATNLFAQSITINPVFTLGFDGTNTNTAFITAFNQVNGTQILGKATGNVRTIAGGTVQDFERGSIFQSAAGTFALQGTLNNFYKDLSASDKLRLGLPIANETSTGGYWHQTFQNGDLQLVQGAPVKWSNQTLINDRYTLLGGATSLGNVVGTIRNVNGTPVQDYDKGSIFVLGTKTVAITGAIATYYRANSATLGIPTGEEVNTSYGKSQTFQGALVTSSTQFGVHTVRGSLGGYYTSLTATQKDQLGAATTEEAVGGDGNWQQFFKGGSVFWKNDGTGEVKVTPFTIGFNGTNVNSTFTTEFNQIVGWDALGKATGNVRSIAGGTVQDFEKGSIFQSAAGTFAVRGQIGVYYRANSATLGLPTTAEISTSYGWRQDFSNGKTLIHSPQFGTQVLQGSLGGYYRGLSESQRNQLGAVYTSEKDLGGGNWRQFFAGGTVEWKNNGTGEVKLTPSFSIGLTGNTVNNNFTDKFDSIDGWNALGSATSNVKIMSGGMVQDFQKGSIFQSAKGTFVLDGILLEMYHQQYGSSIGLPISDKVSTVNGLRQDFENGILVSTITVQTFVLKGAIASYYKGLNDTQLKALGAPINNAGDSNGGVAQYFQNGVVYSSSFGTFSVRGVFSDRATSRGVPIGEEKVVGDGLRQDFSEGSVTYSAKAGIHEITGGLVKYYQSLTDAQKTQLGVAYTNTWSDSNNSFQFFQGGAIESNRSGVNKIRFTPAIGFDGNTFNEKFFDKFMSMGNFDGLGDPITNVFSTNGILRQDFMKGYITQNGSLIESKPYGGTITITNNPPNNGGGVIIITSNPQPNLPSNPTVQYTTETRTVQVPAQNPLPSPVTNASSSADSSLHRDGLDLVYENLSGTVITDYLNLRIDSPYRSSQSDGFVYRNKSLQFNAWAKGEYVGNTDIWLHIAGTRDWVSAYYIQTNSDITTVPIYGANFKGVVNSIAGVNIRRSPTTNLASVGSYNNQTELSFDGYATGESINGNDRWYRIAGTQNWVSSYLIFGSPDRSVSLDSTRPTIKTETVQVPVYTNPTPSQSNGSGNNQFAGVTVGFDGTSAHNTYLNTFNRSGGQGSIGSATNNIHHWGNGYTQDFQGGAEGRGAIMKSDANDNSYWVGGSFWNAYLATGNGADGALGYPTSDRIGNRQNFQNGALISGSNGIFAVYGGIGGHYLNNEGGEKGRLGAPMSGEQGIGNGKIVQHFQNGDILYGNGGASSTLLTAGGAVNYTEFTGVVMTNVVALRNTPRSGDQTGATRSYNETVSFDAYTTGDTLTDVRLGTADNRWFHIKGTNYWVPSAYINGDPGRSVTNPTYIPPTPSNNPSTPVGNNTNPVGNSPSTSTSSSGNTSDIDFPIILLPPVNTEYPKQYINQSIWAGDYLVVFSDAQQKVSTTYELARDVYSPSDYLKQRKTFATKIDTEGVHQNSLYLSKNVSVNTSYDLIKGKFVMSVGVGNFEFTPEFDGTLIAGNFSATASLSASIIRSVFGIDGATEQLKHSITTDGFYINRPKIGEIALEAGAELIAGFVVAVAAEFVTEGFATPALVGFFEAMPKLKLIYDTFKNLNILSKLPTILKSFAI